MSVHLARAQLLLQQSRPVDAEQEAGLAVAQSSDNPAGHVLLALSRLEQNKRALALVAARTALGLAPDSSYYHYVHTLVLERLGQHQEAHAAVREAIRLDPEDENNFCLLASIELSLENWPAALAAAEQALALNPEHTPAINLRAMALVRLGRKEEAVQAVDFALERDPQSAHSHANQGWNQLHRNNPKRALEHFKEALRLDPELEFARSGLLEALKARYIIYRVMLAYFLWMARLSARYRWAIVLGSYLGSRVLVAQAFAHPDPQWLWWVVLGSFYGFLYLTWTAQPMFNLVLRLDRFGRHVLTTQQRLASNWFGPFFAAAFAAMIWFFARHTDLAFFSMYVLAALSICVAAIFVQVGRARLILGAATVLLIIAAGFALAPAFQGGEIENGPLMLFAYGFLGFQFLTSSVRAR